MGYAALGRMDRRASELFLTHFLSGDGLDDLRSGHEHVARSLIHQNEVSVNDLKKYSQIFIKYFSKIFNKENKFIKVIIYPKIVNRFSIFELVICDKKPKIDIEIKENVDYNKEIMTRFSIQKYTDMFYQIKDVVNFEENSFYIIKTNEYKNWHPAMANIDLDTVIEELLSENGGDC